MQYPSPRSVFCATGIIGIGLLFSTLNLRDTYWFAADMARDTLASLRILQNRDITLIGPPLSFGQYGTREIYFGSLSYYFGAAGLALFRLDPLGPVYINSVLMLAGLTAFWILARRYLKSEWLALTALALYAFSPVVVAHLRFYWNPNFILSLAPVLWLGYELARDHSGRQAFAAAAIAGLAGGMIINLHYFAAPVVCAAAAALFAQNKKQSAGFYLFGLLLASLPLLAFELKNNLYLTQAVLFNVFRGESYAGVAGTPWYRKIFDVFRIIPVTLGLDHEVTRLPLLVQLPSPVVVITGIAVMGLLANRARLTGRTDILIFLGLAAVVTGLFSQEDLYIRYFFVSLPLLFLLLADLFSRFRVAGAASFLVILLVSSQLVTFRIHGIARPDAPYPSIIDFERAAEKIRNDQPEGAYNITEHFVGDARATALRFFLERDPSIPKPQDVTQYANLDTLYVFSPDLETVYRDNRWEFRATEGLVLRESYPIRENAYLYTFSTVSVESTQDPSKRPAD
ncbi:MAG: glycosyltransferase family 39 protein [Patescibacteria group bacterium]|nr:glycosyltransferase family 39 protein [Patescibacteria group bacterium]